MIFGNFENYFPGIETRNTIAILSSCHLPVSPWKPELVFTSLLKQQIIIPTMSSPLWLYRKFYKKRVSYVGSGWNCQFYVGLINFKQFWSISSNLIQFKPSLQFVYFLKLSSFLGFKRSLFLWPKLINL